MPGRYSHSVVLAGYSSQGIINLPNDKHVEYVRNTPFVGPPRVKSNANFKPSRNVEPHQRSQSAMAGRSGRWTPAQDMPTSPTARWFINGETDPPASQASPIQDTPVRSTYTARKSIDVQDFGRDSTDLPRSRSVLSTASDVVPQLPVRSEYRPTAKNSPPNNNRSVRMIQPSRSSSEIRNRAANAAAALLQKASERRESSTPAPRSGSTNPTATSAEPPPPPSLPSSQHIHRSGLRHSNSNLTMQTQLREPIRELEEPDFDDFSDSNATETSYFPPTSTISAPQLPMSVPVSTERDRQIEPRSPPTIMSRSRRSYDQNLQVPPSPRSENNTNVISEDSESKLNSMSSRSSMGSSIAQSTRRAVKPVDTKKSMVQPSVAQWGLPEIEEDGVFGPEIFAQDLGNDLDTDLSSPGFGESSFGMISSGRDVDFDADDDALSDAASACPPDIGRYRDSDDGPAPQSVTRLKSEDRRAASPGLLSTKSKKGFLSRLTSKRNWM